MAKIETKNSTCLGNRDRLSEMPDTLLHNIMSFMTARQAVQLCVLSKRWKTLWTTLHILNFSDVEFYHGRQTRCSWDRCQEFVSTILLLRQPTINLCTFTFTWSHLMHSGTVDVAIRPWVRYAVKHNPRVMTIDIEIFKKFCLYPEELFTCPSLEQITLSNCNHAPATINLPFLKRLYLRSSSLDQDFVGKLFEGCPLLVDLHVEGGLLQFSKIASMSLKHLTIKKYNYHPEIQLESINAPNLLSLHLTICAYRYKKQVNLNLPSLCEACIIFDDCALKKIYMTKSLFLYGLFNVQSLELKGCSAESIQYWLETETPKCPSFSMLVSLSMSGLCLICRFDLLSSFTEHCPNLRRLTLFVTSCQCDRFVFHKQDTKRKRIHIERFKCQHLENVEVQYFGSHKTANEVVKSLQEAIKELRNVSIVTVMKLRLPD